MWKYAFCTECNGWVPIGINEMSKQVFFYHFPPKSGLGSTPCAGSGSPTEFAPDEMRDHLEADPIDACG